MKQLSIRFQLLIVSTLLLATFAMLMVIVMKYNHRWDLTENKIYSISDTTEAILSKMQSGPITVIAFYPHDDASRNVFEVFLKECELKHRRFRYAFHDPDRVPRLAKQHGVTEHYTVIIQYQGRTERIVRPTEEAFASALLKLENPREIRLCFVTGHGEASLQGEDRVGYQRFGDYLQDKNYTIQEVILTRGALPDRCDAMIIAGPHRELDSDESDLLRRALLSGRGILYLVDPMDPTAGDSFVRFMKEFGISLGRDVIDDKMSRLVGGDFLVPLVAQYVPEHPITKEFDQATFFPVARSVQPLPETPANYDVTPLAFSGSGSWAESDLETLEGGEAAFDAGADLSGPICVAVASEAKNEGQLPNGRVVVIGDSDFLTNAYLELSGNREFALNVLQWLTKDDRFISIHSREPEFQPLFLNKDQRWMAIAVCLVILPGLTLLLGGVRVLIRNRTT